MIDFIKNEDKAEYKKEINKYSISNDIKNRIDKNKATYKDIKKIREIDNLVKNDNLINFIKKKFTDKLKQYDINNVKNKDINILNCLLKCTLFEKKIKDSELYKNIHDGDEIKNKILDLYEKQMNVYKAKMEENKVYISYTDDNKNNYIFAKINEKDFITRPYKVKCESIFEVKGEKYTNTNKSDCIQFGENDFNKIFKKGEEYKDIILLTNNKNYSYLCYCRPDNFSFHIVHVEDKSFNRFFANYSANKITILYNSPNVTNMSGMFSGCKNLTELDLSKFNTSKVEYIGNMFSDCTSLKNITFVNNFIISNVKNTNGMFSGCTNLTESDKKSIENMFSKYNIKYDKDSLFKTKIN